MVCMHGLLIWRGWLIHIVCALHVHSRPIIFFIIYWLSVHILRREKERKMWHTPHIFAQFTRSLVLLSRCSVPSRLSPLPLSLSQQALCSHRSHTLPITLWLWLTVLSELTVIYLIAHIGVRVYWTCIYIRNNEKKKYWVQYYGRRIYYIIRRHFIWHLLHLFAIVLFRLLARARVWWVSYSFTSLHLAWWRQFSCQLLVVWIVDMGISVGGARPNECIVCTCQDSVRGRTPFAIAANNKWFLTRQPVNKYSIYNITSRP